MHFSGLLFMIGKNYTKYDIYRKKENKFGGSKKAITDIIMMEERGLL